MTPTPLHARPAGLPEAVRWCGWCAVAYARGLGHKCPPSGATRPATTEGRATKASGKFAATPTHVDGIRFASKTEAGLYEWAKSRGPYVIIPHVRFPLHVLTSPGVPAAWFTPDLLILDPWPEFQGGDGWRGVEAWEAKGAKACESRDYQLRARAFRRSYPSIPLRVFRKAGGEFVEDTPAPVGGKEAT